MEDAREWRGEAERYRRMALNINDAWAIVALYELANEFDALANCVEEGQTWWQGFSAQTDKSL